MNSDNQAYFTLRLLVGLAAAGLLLYFMYLMSGLINNLFIAYIIAIVASPLLLWLRKKEVPDWLAFVLTLVAVAAAVLVIVAFIVLAASQLATTIPTYIEDLEGLQNYLNESLMNIALLEQNLSRLVGSIEIRQMFELAGSFLGFASGVLNNTFMIILFVVFMLVQVFTTPRIVAREIAQGNPFLERIIGYNTNLRRYIVITTIIAIVTGALDTILFIILGIPDPLVWGIVAGLLSFVPTIGFWLAAIPPTVLALLEFGPATAVLTLAGILLINGFADNVIKPRYIGEGVDLAPFVVIFSVVFWAIILGPAGAVIGVPLTMLIKSLLFEPDDHISWIAHLMGSGSLPAESAPVQESAVAQETADIE